MPKVKSVRQGDLARVIRALGSAGHQVERVEVRPSGEVVLFPGVAGSPPDSQVNDLDAWRMKRAAR
jgi:hypothetical protein